MLSLSAYNLQFTVQHITICRAQGMLRCRDARAQRTSLTALNVLATHCPSACQALPQTGMPVFVRLLAHTEPSVCEAAAAVMATLARDASNQTAIGNAAPFAPLAALVTGAAGDAARAVAADVLHHVMLGHVANKGEALASGVAPALVALCQSQVRSRQASFVPPPFICTATTCMSAALLTWLCVLRINTLWSRPCTHCSRL